MSDPVWHRIDRELSRRKAAHLLPGTWAALGRIIEVTAQVLTNWKARGVPPKEHQAIADALGWSVDQLLGTGEAPAKAPAAEPMVSLLVTPEEMGWVLAHRNAIARRERVLKQPPKPPPKQPPPAPAVARKRGGQELMNPQRTPSTGAIKRGKLS